ncbi:radical SAM protein [candidate division KSB1 bacterium]|nr:radical SAM protein [candidate division KSB1 bacterium]
MPESLHSVYVLPIANRWLLHAPLHGITALVNSATIEALLHDKALPDGSLQVLQNQEPPAAPAPHTGPIQPEFLGIIPTRACNMRCIYCGFGAVKAQDGQTLDLKRAVLLVDWMADWLHQHQRTHFDIHFFGGEPFCAPDVVDTVVHRARMLAGAKGLRLRFEADTNGFFDADRCRLIGDYIDSVVMSFDGPEDIQNRHRPAKNGAASFPVVAANAWALSRMPVELCLRICVTQETVGRLAEISQWFCRQFHPDIIDYEPLRPTQESQEAGLMPPDPWSFARSYMQSAMAATEAGTRTIYAAAGIDRVRHSFCPVGRDTLILSPDGRLSACYLQQQEWRNKGLDLDLGRVEPAKGVNIQQASVERVRELTSHAPVCRTCFARWHCAGGCHVDNYEMRRDGERTPFCIQTRLIAACNLLNELGCQNELNHLLEDREQQEKLVLQRSDCIDDWRG